MVSSKMRDSALVAGAGEVDDPIVLISSGDEWDVSKELIPSPQSRKATSSSSRRGSAHDPARAAVHVVDLAGSDSDDPLELISPSKTRRKSKSPVRPSDSTPSTGKRKSIDIVKSRNKDNKKRKLWPGTFSLSGTKEESDRGNSGSVTDLPEMDDEGDVGPSTTNSRDTSSSNTGNMTGDDPDLSQASERSPGKSKDSSHESIPERRFFGLFPRAASSHSSQAPQQSSSDVSNSTTNTKGLRRSSAGPSWSTSDADSAGEVSLLQKTKIALSQWNSGSLAMGLDRVRGNSKVHASHTTSPISRPKSSEPQLLAGSSRDQNTSGTSTKSSRSDPSSTSTVNATSVTRGVSERAVEPKEMNMKASQVSQVPRALAEASSSRGVITTVLPEKPASAVAETSNPPTLATGVASVTEVPDGVGGGEQIPSEIQSQTSAEAKSSYFGGKGKDKAREPLQPGTPVNTPSANGLLPEHDTVDVEPPNKPPFSAAAYGYAVGARIGAAAAADRALATASLPTTPASGISTPNGGAPRRPFWATSPPDKPKSASPQSASNLAQPNVVTATSASKPDSSSSTAAKGKSDAAPNETTARMTSSNTTKSPYSQLPMPVNAKGTALGPTLSPTLPPSTMSDTDTGSPVTTAVHSSVHSSTRPASESSLHKSDNRSKAPPTSQGHSSATSKSATPTSSYPPGHWLNPMPFTKSFVDRSGTEKTDVDTAIEKKRREKKEKKRKRLEKLKQGNTLVEGSNSSSTPTSAPAAGHLEPGNRPEPQPFLPEESKRRDSKDRRSPSPDTKKNSADKKGDRLKKNIEISNLNSDSHSQIDKSPTFPPMAAVLPNQLYQPPKDLQSSTPLQLDPRKRLDVSRTKSLPDNGSTLLTAKSDKESYHANVVVQALVETNKATMNAARAHSKGKDWKEVNVMVQGVDDDSLVVPAETTDSKTISPAPTELDLSTVQKGGVQQSPKFISPVPISSPSTVPTLNVVSQSSEDEEPIQRSGAYTGKKKSISVGSETYPHFSPPLADEVSDSEEYGSNGPKLSRRSKNRWKGGKSRKRVLSSDSSEEGDVPISASVRHARRRVILTSSDEDDSDANDLITVVHRAESSETAVLRTARKQSFQIPKGFISGGGKVIKEAKGLKKRSPKKERCRKIRHHYKLSEEEWRTMLEASDEDDIVESDDITRHLVKEEGLNGMGVDLAGITGVRACFTFRPRSEENRSQTPKVYTIYNSSDDEIIDDAGRPIGRAKDESEDEDLYELFPDPPVPPERRGVATRTFDTKLLDNWNRRRSRFPINPDIHRTIFEDYIMQSTACDEPESEIHVVNDVDDSAPAPNFEFVYSNDMLYSENVPDPEKGLGCGCEGPCDTKNRACTCLRRQELYSYGFVDGFCYDANGRITNASVPIWECSETCGCSSDCPNRVIQRGRLPETQVEIFKTKYKGWGIRARKAIPQGTFLGIYAGELISESSCEERGRVYEKANTTYLFDLDGWQIHEPPEGLEEVDQRLAELAAATKKRAERSMRGTGLDHYNAYSVDAYHYGNFTRYFNHSCDPNLVIVQAYVKDFHPERPLLVIFTRHDVKKNEELCISYKGLPDEEEIIVSAPKKKSKKGKGRAQKTIVKSSATTHVSTSMAKGEQRVASKANPCRCGKDLCDGVMFNWGNI